jgi:hypothetical protein
MAHCAQRAKYTILEDGLPGIASTRSCCCGVACSNGILVNIGIAIGTGVSCIEGA